MSITQIATNYEAIFANKTLAQMSSKASKAMSHISSGKRIVSAGDDPVGVAMMSSMKSKMTANREIQRGMQDGLELLKFSDAILSQMEDTLIEMQAIANRIGNDATLSTGQTTALRVQYSSIAVTVQTTAMNQHTWNGKAVADGTSLAGNTANIVVDASGNRQQLDAIATGFGTAWNIGNLTNTVGSTIASSAAAAAEISNIDAALGVIAGYRSGIGSLVSRIENSLEMAVTAEMTYTSSYSAISDADIAAEVTQMATAQVLAQADSAMIAQANSQANIVLSLLG